MLEINNCQEYYFTILLPKPVDAVEAAVGKVNAVAVVLLAGLAPKEKPIKTLILTCLIYVQVNHFYNNI